MSRAVTSLALEVPLNESEARTRGLPPDISRLVLAKRRAARDVVGALEVYAHIVYLWKRLGENVYVVPIVPFSSGAAMQGLIDALSLHVLCVGSERAMRCDSEHAVSGVLEKLDCEELALFFAEGDPAAARVVAAVAAYTGPGASHNAPFLRAKTGQEGFVFYAPTHVSFEVLGSLRFVLDRCFATAVRHLREEA